MSFQLFCKAYDVIAQEPLEKLALIYLANGADMEGFIRVDARAVADFCNVRVEDASNALAELRAQGLIIGGRNELWVVLPSKIYEEFEE